MSKNYLASQRFQTKKTIMPHAENKLPVELIRPFRWNIAEQEQLGTLLEGNTENAYPGFADDLIECCARVIAFSGNADLVFVGRSPESLFDHLSGLLWGTSWQNRLTLLQFSIGRSLESQRERNIRAAIHAYRAYLTALNLSPQQIIQRKRPVAFVDLVDGGTTFHHLMQILHDWAIETHCDWKSVKRKVKIVGIIRRWQTSPKTWRWQQEASWVSEMLESRAVKNISIPRRLYIYLGNEQQKVTRSFTPKNWKNTAYSMPFRQESYLEALRFAKALFELGRTQTRRNMLVHCLIQEREMKEEWLRKLVLELNVAVKK